MADPTRRRQLEAMLADDPDDAFLRYALAMDHAGAGDLETAVRQLRDLIALDPQKPYVPAFLQAGQFLTRLDRPDEAAELLRAGVEAARRQNDLHAMGEMQGLLASIE